MQSDATVALRHLEHAEEILSRIDGHEEHRDRVTDARERLGRELLNEAYADMVADADPGDVLILDEAGGDVLKRSDSEVGEE